MLSHFGHHCSPDKYNSILNINLILLSIAMSQAAQTVNANKTKTIAKKSVGRPVRLWVRAKFLGFRRYPNNHLDQKFNKMSINPS